MAASAYLISKSALITNVAEVALVITSVRVLAIGRAAFRYLERYVTHRATFEILDRPARLVLRRHRAARARPPDRPSPRRPAGADRRRRRDARGLLRPGHPAAGRRPSSWRSSAGCCWVRRSGRSASPSSLSWSWPGSSSRSSPVACRAARPRSPSRPAASSTPGSSTRSPGLADLIALDRAAAHRERTLALGDDARPGDGPARACPRGDDRRSSGLVASLAGVAVLAIGHRARRRRPARRRLPRGPAPRRDRLLRGHRPARPGVRPPGRERGRGAPPVRADRRAARGPRCPDRDRHARRRRFGLEIRGLRFRYGPTSRGSSTAST